MDPNNQEAKEYLDKIRTMPADKKTFESEKARDSEIRELHKQGRELYGRRDYEGALKVFSKALELKPIDELASYYKENCEILIARKLARERKIEQKKILQEKSKQERIDRRQEKETEKLDRQAMLAKRAEINKERQTAQKEKKTEVTQEKAEAKPAERTEAIQKALEEKITPVQTSQAVKLNAKEEKRRLALERKEEKVKAKEERIAQKKEKIEARKQAKEEKRAESEDLKNERLKAKKEKIVEKTEALETKKKAAEKKKETLQEQEQIKEFFLQGVEHYGRKEYDEAITSFKRVIDAESSGKKNYTNAAMRLMDKTRKRMAAAQR